MNKGNVRYKIDALLRVARLTNDEDLRGEVVREALRLLDSISVDAGEDLEGIAEKTLVYIATTQRNRINALHVWAEGLNRDPSDITRHESRYICNVIREAGEWQEIGKARCDNGRSLICFERIRR